MKSEKTFKAIIIVSLFVIESFVWTLSGSNDSWSMGIIGGTDGPGSTIISDDNNKNTETGEKNGQPEKKPDQADNQGPKDTKQSKEAMLADSKEKGFLILVNRENQVSETYKPKDLEPIKYYAPDREKSSRFMRAEASEAFNSLVEAAAKDEVILRMTTAYRSYNFQKTLYDSYVEKEGQEAADRFSAKPGCSEHQTGLAVDVSSPSVNYELTDQFGETREGKWLSENAYRYGFIIRFPKGKEDITGYQYEPWHIRYVGLEAAKEIHDQGLTLEEFLQKR